LELLDGRIFRKMTQKGPHVWAVRRAERLLAEAFGPGHSARSQAPILLHDESEPEPDVSVVTGGDDDYLDSPPAPAQVFLVVEVSDTTLRFDRGRKQRAYARAGIREYWVLNLRARQLEVYRDPSETRYQNVIEYREGETVTPLAAPGAEIRVSDLLPPVTGSEPS
jgi:Uma2 family endonuclease